QTATQTWTEGGVLKSTTIAKAKAGSWNTGSQDGIFEWNFTTDAAQRPAWDTSGTYAYMVHTGGEIPDAWLPLDPAQPVLIAMPVKFRSYLFEQFVRARYIQVVDRLATVRAVSKTHAVYDTLNHVTWLQENQVSEKGSLADP
ncbi:MAG TPA: hypothetical protein VL860_11775, partial [Planctomycetota bacterium]|nr:hypothetical protein [Planctomycetota bacterium]